MVSIVLYLIKIQTLPYLMVTFDFGPLLFFLPFDHVNALPQFQPPPHLPSGGEDASPQICAGLHTCISNG